MESPFCKAGADGKYPDAVVIQSSGNDGQHDFGYGGGCIRRPLREAWAASHNSPSLAWTDADLVAFAQVIDPRADFLFSVKYEAGPTPFTQRWTMEYYHKVLEGTVREPRRVLIQYKKVFGSDYIPYWQGSIELRAVAPNVTAFVMRNDITAAQTGPTEAAGAVRDMLVRLRATAPEWKYLGTP